MQVRMMGLHAVILALPVTCLAWGFASERQLGNPVDDVTLATIRGGGCQNRGNINCDKVGSCAAIQIVIFSGDGDFQQDTTDNCGNGTACISVTKKEKKCGG